MRRKVAKKARCPVDGKVTYRDQHSARRAVNNVKMFASGSKMPQRVYWCEDAGGWHLTSTDEISGLFAERARLEHE